MAGPKTDFQVLNFKAVTVLSTFKVGPRYRKRLLAGETSQLPGGFRPRQARFRLYLLPTPQSAKTVLDWKLHVRWGALNKITQPMAGLDVAFGKRGEQSTKVYRFYVYVSQALCHLPAMSSSRPTLARTFPG